MSGAAFLKEILEKDKEKDAEKERLRAEKEAKQAQNPFKCPYCPKAYANSGGLYNHAKLKHPDEGFTMRKRTKVDIQLKSEIEEKLKNLEALQAKMETLPKPEPKPEPEPEVPKPEVPIEQPTITIKELPKEIPKEIPKPEPVPESDEVDMAMFRGRKPQAKAQIPVPKVLEGPSRSEPVKIKVYDPFRRTGSLF